MKGFTKIINTRNGEMPVEVFYPELSNAYPSVIFYTDVFGLRDELRDMCRRIASVDHAVFMPSMHYRDGNPTFPPATGQMEGLSIPVWGMIGYCMGGRHAMAGAAANPNSVRAATSLHGGKLVNDTDTSTHRVIDDVYFGFAKNDPTCPDAHQRIIHDAFEQSATPGRVDYYEAQYGWTFPERHCFNK